MTVCIVTVVKPPMGDPFEIDWPVTTKAFGMAPYLAVTGFTRNELPSVG